MNSSSDDKSQNLWPLYLSPSFDPAVDNVCEYTDKVKFLHAICPDKDRPMLAPRLAMVCKVQRGGKSET